MSYHLCYLLFAYCHFLIYFFFSALFCFVLFCSYLLRHRHPLRNLNPALPHECCSQLSCPSSTHPLYLSVFFLLSSSPTLFSQVVNIEEQRITGTNDSTHWYGHLRGGVSLTKVQQSSLQLHSQIKVQYKADPHLVLLLLNVILEPSLKEN